MRSRRSARSVVPRRELRGHHRPDVVTVGGIPWAGVPEADDQPRVHDGPVCRVPGRPGSWAQGAPERPAEDPHISGNVELDLPSFDGWTAKPWGMPWQVEQRSALGPAALEGSFCISIGEPRRALAGGPDEEALWLSRSIRPAHRDTHDPAMPGHDMPHHATRHHDTPHPATRHHDTPERAGSESGEAPPWCWADWRWS